MVLRRLRHLGALDLLVAVTLVIAAAAAIAHYAGLRGAGAYDIGWTAAAVAALAGTISGLKQAHPENRVRWALWSLANLCWLIGQLLWDIYALAGYPGSPNPADIMWWLFPVLITISVVRVPRATRSMAAVALAESIPLVCAAVALCLSLLYSRYVHAHEPRLERISYLVYPCLYASSTIVTLQACLGGALRGQRRPSLAVFFAGTALTALAFMLWSVELLRGHEMADFGLLDPLWVVGMGLIGVGGLMAAHDPEGPPVSVGPDQVRVLLPASLFSVMVIVLLLEAILGASRRAEEILVFGLLCSGVALIGRSTLLSRRLAGLLDRERAIATQLATREDELVKVNDQLVLLNAQLVEDSRHDALTGIRNRRALSDDLPMYRTLQAEAGEEIAVLLCDVDHFKSYNDRFGHLVGDQALTTIAAIARSTLRSGDAAYRFGGEELLLILRDADTHDGLLVAERIREAVQRAALAHPLPTSGVLTVSIGVASGFEAPEDLLSAADDALYAAKEAGRNRVIASGDAAVVSGSGRARETEADDPVSRQLRSMLTVSRAAATAEGELPLLEAVGQVIHRELSFGVVAVSLLEGDDTVRACVVLGDQSAREMLLDRETPLGEWQELMAVSQEIHGAAWLPAGSYDPDTQSGTWRGQMVAPLSTDAWHPDDMLLLPLRGATRQLLGFISIDQPVLGQRPGDGEIAVLMAVADHAALALEQVRHRALPLVDESEALHLAAVMLLAEALDLRDPSTALHSRTVGGLARQTARELGYSEAQVERVYAAGVLHDLGKLGIADAILHKPQSLDGAEWREMHRHPEIGARILEHAGMRDIAAWVRAHHERIDGQGYPQGLAPEQISLESRILSVADAYEAMIADRPYRTGMSAQAAREELIASSGTQFDTTVVAAFLRALDTEAPEGQAQAEEALS